MARTLRQLQISIVESRLDDQVLQIIYCIHHLPERVTSRGIATIHYASVTVFEMKADSWNSVIGRNGGDSTVPQFDRLSNSTRE